MTRPRAAAAIIRDGNILMVFYKLEEREFWTLPGGGLLPGETFEEAAIRESMEEANIPIRIERFLFEREYRAGIEKIFLAHILDDAVPTPGYDPELPPEKEQWIREVRWHPLESMKEDRQVKLVIEALGCEK